MRRWPLLRNRDYMLLWSGEVLSELGSQTSSVAYPLLILALTGSPAKAGIVGLAKWLPIAVFALPAGALADRVDRKRLMIASDAIRLVGAASIVVLLAIARPPYLQVIVVAFVDGALFTVSYVCERGALRQVVPTELVPEAIAQNEARTFGASIAGPPLGGVLFAAARSLPFIADSVSFAASMTSIALTRTRFQADPGSAPPPARRIRSDIADGFTWLWRHPFFRVASIVFALGNPVFTGLYLLAILLARQHGASSATIGFMLAIVGAGGLVGALAASAIRRVTTPRTLVLAEQWLVLAMVLALLLVHDALLVGVLIGAAELVTPAVNSVVAGARVAVAPDHLQGRIQAAATLLTMSLGWLGPLAVGLLYEHGGATTTILTLAGWAVLPALSATFARALHDGPPLSAAAVTG